MLKDIRLGVKFYEPSSTFKKQLFGMKTGARVVASQLSGDFTLPKDTNEKLVFIAGGIGVTPFRSMVRHLLDTGEKRDIVMLYANRISSDVAYREVFQEAERVFGTKTVYVSGDGNPSRIDAALIMHEVPDFSERMFYISGPQAMVTSMAHTLIDMGIHRSRIKKDYFPGFA